MVREHVFGKVAVVGDTRVAVPWYDVDRAEPVLGLESEVQVGVAVVFELHVVGAGHAHLGVERIVGIDVDRYLVLRALICGVERDRVPRHHLRDVAQALVAFRAGVVDRHERRRIDAARRVLHVGIEEQRTVPDLGRVVKAEQPLIVVADNHGERPSIGLF